MIILVVWYMMGDYILVGMNKGCINIIDMRIFEVIYFEKICVGVIIVMWVIFFG